MSNGVPKNALFVCFGCLSNVGTLTGLAGLEVVKQVGLETAGIFCLGGLATESKMVTEKTSAAERIITVDGCPLNCALKIVEKAGFTPDKVINLVQDCGIKKGPPLQYDDADMQVAIEAIRAAVLDGHPVQA
ncbi:MAG: putative zinc-binding protein [Anaerolineales bacterium]|nr:putative zinc-binding protein [Anaerolineales bacterium]